MATLTWDNIKSASQPKPAAQPQAVNRYQNYLDMGDIIRQESQADKGVAISPQMIMAEFMKRQQNGTEPVAQLTNPENTGARIQRYENNRQRLAALDSQIRSYGQAVLHPGKDNTALKQLMAQRDAMALEQQQYERLYKSSDYGADARKQADFTERAAVTSHEDDPEYIAVNYSRYSLPEEQFHTEAESKKYAYADLNSLNPRRAEPGKAVTVTDDPVLNRAKDMSQYSGFRNMTDEERDTYNYLYETRGKEVAHQYLQDQIIDVDKRESQKAAEATAKAYEEASIPAKIATNIATVPASILGGAVGALSDAATAIGGKYNPYSPAHGMTEFAQTVRGKTAEEIAAGISNETVGAFASNTYQAIMSAADSVLGAYTMGPAYTVAMGAGAASSRAKELYEQGASNMQVLQGSLAAGVAETLFEYVSLDKLIKTGASETVKEWVTNILKQSFTEASEEVSTEITNKVFDAIIRGGKSDHSRAEQAYIEAGETPENARRLAWRDDVTDILWAGYGGAVSGGLSAAGYGGIATMQHIQEVKQVGQRYLTEDSGGKTRLTEAMEIGLSNAQGTEALATAQGIQRQMAQGKQPTAYQVGKMLLESTTEKAMRAREIEGEILNSARENGVNDKTAQAVAALMVRADRAARFVSPETLQTVGEGDGQYSIVTLDDGKTYVTSDRNVLSGTNPHNWRQQINQFFNDVLLENGSLTVDTVDGDTMTITKRETVGKGKDKFTQIGGTRYELTNEEYYVKLQALSHIDELTETAQCKRDVQGNIKAYPDTKSHSFARDGFAYPVVFFEDADGNYYKITLSVGMENGIGTVYNIGRMQKTDKPTRAILSVIGSKVNRRDSSIAGSQALGLSVSDTTIPQNGSGVNTQYMQNSGENAPVYQAYGRYTADGVVELASNITTDEAMDFVIKHELTHAIEGSAAYTKLKRLVRQQMGEAEYAAAVERERQSRSAKGDTQGAADAEAEVVADWIAQNLYRDGFARMIRNMDGGAAVQFQAVLDSFRRTLGLTGNQRQVAAIRWAERAFAEVLDSDYSSANENTAAETGDGGKYDMTIPFAEQVNQAINHTLNPRNALYVGETSDILQKVGLSDLPMLYTQRHLADAIRSKADGGHGLTVNDILAMPEIVQHPALVMDSLTRDDSIVLVSDRLDGDGYPIIMTVRANGTGTYDLQQISSNFITSYYGKDSDFSGFIERAIAADKVLYIDKKKSQALYRQAGLQLPYGFQRLGFDTIIHSSNNVVNTQSMQNSENNSSDGQKSYLPAEILERENAAAPRSGINPDFEQEYNAWDKKSVGGYFVLGTTSDALQSIGIEPAKIYWDKSKIKKILDNPNHHMENAIPKVPELLEHPILIMQSQTVLNRVVLLGEINDDLGYPVLCALELRPNGEINNFVKVASAYGKDSRGGVQNLINTSDILYVDPDRKRTDSWLEARRLQLPVGLTNYGSIGRVAYFGKDVKGNFTISGGTSTKTAMQTAFEKAAKRSAQSQSMQNSENNSSDGQKSYLPAELMERENAAAAEKAENARRLAEERAEKQRQQEAQTRQQREETAGELQRKNAALQQRLERAQRETRLTTEKTVRAEDVAKLTRKILREYSSTLKSDSILDAMQALGDTIVQGGQLDYDTLHGQALDIARQIIDRSEALIDDGESATYDGIRQYLRENKIAVSEEEKADIPDYEAWRRRNQRRMNLSKEGTPVDVIYGEMQELFGKGLLPDILNPSEQLQYLAELRDNMEPEYGNPYESDMEQAVEACAGDILDGMLSAQVRQTSPTFADKAQAQLERQKNLAHAALEREVQRRHKALETQRTKMQAQAQAAQERAEARRERSLETQRNRYQDLLTREKVKTAEARVQGENAVRETKAENRQRNRDAAERRKKTAEKQRVGKMLDSLESMLAKPDKNHHIPAAATEAVRNLLATVREDPADIQAQINELQLKLQDTSDGRQIDRIRRRIAERQARLDKTTSLYEAVGKVQDTYGDIAGETVEGEPVNSGFQHYLQEVKEMVDDRRVSDLSAAELHELVEVIKAVHGQLKQMNTLHGKAFREGAQETGLQMAEEMTAAKGYSNTALRNFMLWQLTPDRFLEAICGWKQDSVGAKLAAEMVEAQRTELEIQRAYGQRFYDLVNGSNAKNYDRLSSTKDSDLVDVGLVDSQGKAMKMTRGLMLSLYESLCCKGNRQALTDGGMMLPQLKLYYSGKAADAYVHSQALTPTALSGEIHNVLEEMNKFPTGSQEYANLHKEYMELVGRANQDLDRLKARIEGEMTDYERQLHRAIRQWFDKDSKEYLNDVTTRLWNYEAARVKDYFPIYRSKDFVSTALESLVTDRTLASNGNLKARLKSKAPVLIADITQVLNRSAAQTARFCGWTPFQEDFTRIYNANDRDKGLSFKQALGLKWGADPAHLGATGNQYIQNLMADISGGREGGSSFLRFFRQNAVRATLSVNMRVAVSQAASLPTAAAEIGWKYTARAMKHLAEVNQQTMDRIAHYSAYFYERRRGAGGMEEFALAKDGSNVLDKAYQSLDKATKGRLLNWCQEVDIRTVALCWFGCEEAIRDTRPELKAGSDAYYKAVGEMLDRVIIKTQPNFTTAQRSDLLRTKNEAVKFLTMYKTQANQNMNILYEVTGRLRAALQSGDKAQIRAAKKAMVNGYTAVIAGGTIAFVLLRTLVNLLQHRVKGYRDKDGEITAASMTGAIGQEVLSSMAGMFAFGDAVYDVVSARVFGERYYGVSDVALGNVSSLLEDFATGNFTSETAWRNLWRDTMNALGIPWKNLEDIAGGIIGHITDIAHGEFLSFNANSGLETAAYYRQLLHAQQNGKTEKAAKVREFLLTSGKTETQIQAGLRKVIQEDSDFQKREKRLLREAMESVMYRSMTEKEQKKVKSGLDGYLADTMLEGSIGSKMTTAHQKAQKIIDRGVSPAAYYVGEAAKNGTTADKNGDGTVTRQEYRAMLSQSDYDQITQAVLLAQKSNSKKK